MFPEWTDGVAKAVGNGLVTTLLLAAVILVASGVFGVLLGMLYTVPFKPLRLLLRGYIEFWRGLPMLVTIFLIFFGLPVIGVMTEPFVAAAIALSLWGSANLAEIVQGAINSLPEGQNRAAAALGMPWHHRMLSVLLPQAARRALPPTIGIVTILIQSTTLASLVGLREGVSAARQQMERLTLFSGDSHATTIFGVLMLVFFVICFPLSVWAKRAERRLD